MNIAQLNVHYALANELGFAAGQGDFPLIKIHNAHAQAVICVYGAQVLSFKPHNTAVDWLFVSEQALYQSGKAIRGGIPVCWPWFGPDPEGKGRAAHGFARTRLWSVLATSTQADGATKVSLGLQDTEETRQLWPYAFNLRLDITVGKTLQLALTTRNTDTQTFTLTQALHTYFNVGDINQTRVQGLDRASYMDKAADGHGMTRQQQGAVTIAAEVDRVYLQVSPLLVLEADALHRRIQLTNTGTDSAVIWNPWSKLAAAMADLPDEAYQHFLCIETTNAGPDCIEVQAGQEHCLSVVYSDLNA